MIKLAKLISTFLTAILLFSTAFGQSEKDRINSYINSYKEFAITEMIRTGVPAAITLAQGILETGGGQSDLALLGNNHFGIKCKSEWTGESMLHDDDAKNECFRKYGSVEESYKDHSDFLKTRACYAFLFKLDPTDYEGWAKGLKKAGYATSSTYSRQLIKLIVENNLQDFTLAALQGGDGQEEIFAAGNVNNVSKGSDINEGQQAPIAKVNTGITNVKVNNKVVKYPVNSVFVINDLKVVYAEAGTSLFALANNYNVGFKKLLEFNDLDETDILKDGQLIYLEKKSKKGTKDVHVVEGNETMHDISQKEGIQLSAMLEYNGLSKGMQPAAGEKIYLKYAAPSSPKLASSELARAYTSM